jgi:hypothetical protein
VTDRVITLDEMVLAWPHLASRHQAARELSLAGYDVVTDELGRPGLALPEAKRWVDAWQREQERLAAIKAAALEAAKVATHVHTGLWGAALNEQARIKAAGAAR